MASMGKQLFRRRWAVCAPEQHSLGIRAMLTAGPQTSTGNDFHENWIIVAHEGSAKTAFATSLATVADEWPECLPNSKLCCFAFDPPTASRGHGVHPGCPTEHAAIYGRFVSVLLCFAGLLGPPATPLPLLCPRHQR